mmetsp:Transcript_27647/g.55452  ORF Transcript_27647/g.55452 Transcript_27647/m.55452 type:complete len:952 (-) Transcript_27647:656-3511(-)|eukprot:CAMPEP_0113392038 /NCGR_PEP_ID=MMETSP0013_2-20120614/11059_1 /TAXON_ID=2843 ORGANISM="Skeletonema costatum, Strain 1716" /NCGR_SAMPLE_ID=MMETSP0013_2 /ASSEMBLY_ACC=CAM_ASM_000158 /LENGTH=951 /DNA_ID=CAMNT_0000275379 /DNA_START=173 /DNA_END=3028 /DNA_ORIENTATION=+ /assembly_acc=CAM_ASM_000158
MEVAVDNVIEESEGKNDSAIDDPSNNINSNMNDDNAAYESDYSLRIPISNVRFRGSQLHVIDTDHDQLILKQQLGNDEKKHNKTTLVKRLSPITFAQRAIRIGYSLITIIFVGFLFVFCCEVLLFLGIALPVSANEAWSIPQMHLFSTLLSIPVLLYGLTSLMTMGCAFVIDAHRGGALFRSTAMEIIYLIVFLIAPMTTAMICLMAQSEEPWRITSLVWAILILITFAGWALAVTYKQMKACFLLVDKCFPLEEEEPNNFKRFMKIANRALLITQTKRYSGTKRQRYLVAGDDLTKTYTESQLTPVETRTGCFSRLVSLKCCSKINTFESVDPPKKLLESDEIMGYQPVMTKTNWSMQKYWCAGSSHQSALLVTGGSSALSSEQMKFSVLCTVTSVILASLLFIGVLVWMEMGLVIYLLVAVIALLCCVFPMFRNSREMLKLYDELKENNDDEEDNERGGKTMMNVWERVIISEPKPWLCYAFVAFEVVFFFIWPFISMLVLKNYPIAGVFFVLGFFDFLWRYFDASSVLAKYGTISDAAELFNEEYDGVTHAHRYRFSQIVGGIIRNKGRLVWTWIFVFVFLVVWFMLSASQSSSATITAEQRGPRPPILLLNDFYYPGVNTLAYPTCKLTKGFEFPVVDGQSAKNVSSDLGDYAFLSAMAYERESINQYTLQEWFGGGVIDEVDYVKKWREESGTQSSPVYFKLFSAPELNSAVVSVRGSETMFDWLSNLHLWFASGVAQCVKWLTPFGWIWTPIIPDLLEVVNSVVESQKLKEQGYYVITSQFVNAVRAGYGGANYTNVFITGASLGGGVAMISGAQTGTPTVSISGPGPLLPRKIFHPPLTVESIDSNVYNFIPERDYIARLGGRPMFYQNAMCIASNNNLFGCHSMWRSFCEINYRCGSNGRPVACRCVERFGYPKPIQNGTRTFEEACAAANETWYDMFPDVPN